MTEGVLWISGKIKEIGQFENFSLIDSLTKNIINMISAYEDWLPQFVATLPNIMSVLVDSVTTIGFSIIIAIYMLADFKTIRHNIKSTFVALFPSSEKYLYEIDENVTRGKEKCSFLRTESEKTALSRMETSSRWTSSFFYLFQSRHLFSQCTFSCWKIERKNFI